MRDNPLLIVAALVATVVSFPTFAKSSNQSLEQRIEKLELQEKNRTEIQIRLSQQVDSLQKEVQELRALAEEQGYKIKQLQDRQRDLYGDIERRLSALQASGTTAKTPVNNAALTADSKIPVQKGERQEYEAAFALVRDNQYPKAIEAFEAFLQKYPKGSFSDNAIFWIGQIHFVQGDLTNGEKNFSNLVENFPKSSKTSAALVGLAKIKQKQEKWQEAKELYNRVIDNYTGAQQQLARKGLEDIKKAGH
ncbi:MAG: tol-pal system protein YbgF [Gammaproteobacteria bacterium]|nr:tol-pal system protein YbgF [Gammaproteobacteria bacterium]MDH5629857.1 tol-pal system protein YbgF [Gammaproteobacteria bacterium]